LNTALVGNDSAARLGLNSRYQWPNLSSPYITSSVNFHQFIPKLNAYAGINYMNDNQANGTLISNNFSVFYSQNINIKKVLFRPSFEFSYGNLKLDNSKLIFGDMIEPRRGFVWSPTHQLNYYKSYLDFNLGGMLYYKSLLIGFSAHHITTPDVGLQGTSKIPIRYGVQLGYTIRFKKTSVSPFVFYNQQQNFQSLVGGVNVLLFNHLNVAVSYRNSDAIITSVGYQNRFFKINYSYDYTTSSLRNVNTGGSHELGMAFKFWKVKTKKRFIGVSSIYS
jgi:type IX secretion system PorP/SprF family membrane protein